MKTLIFNTTRKTIHLVDENGKVIETFNPLFHRLIEFRDLSSGEKVENLKIKDRELTYKNIFLYNKKYYFIVELEYALLNRELNNLLIVSKEDIYMIKDGEYYVKSLTRLNIKFKKR